MNEDSVIVLLDTSENLDDCASELKGEVGQLLTPLTRFRLRDPDRPWGIDNGAYAGLDIPAFMALLEREWHHAEKCLFVVVPDIVASARRTLELFAYWHPRLTGWRLALACQDGQEDLPIPWDQIAAVFIGGSTKWKCSEAAAQIVKTAKAMGKWAHVGRVNHPERFKHFEAMGADSIDGTGLARFTHMRKAIARRHDQEALCF